MFRKRIGLRKVPGKFVVVGLVILLGVLSMTFGYYENNHTAMYVGFGITILSAFNGVVLLATRPDEIRLFRRWR